jgi:hypothetical protein
VRSDFVVEQLQLSESMRKREEVGIAIPSVSELRWREAIADVPLPRWEAASQDSKIGQESVEGRDETVPVAGLLPQFRHMQRHSGCWKRRIAGLR